MALIRSRGSMGAWHSSNLARRAQGAIHQTALKQFDSFIEARRTRLYRVSSGMPHVMWYTVALGALINMIFLWLFDLRVSTHLLLGGLVSFFTATMIYVIAILDT